MDPEGEEILIINNICSEVGKRFDKRPIVPVFSKKLVKVAISHLHEPLVAYGCKVLPYAENVTSAVEFVSLMIGFEKSDQFLVVHIISG